MSYSRADFTDEQKWRFFQEFITNQRQDKKNLQRNYKHSVKTYKELKSTMKGKHCLNESSEEFLKVRILFFLIHTWNIVNCNVVDMRMP